MYDVPVVFGKTESILTGMSHTTKILAIPELLTFCVNQRGAYI